MRFESFKQKIDELKEQKPILFELESDPHITENKIKEIEDYFQFNLPLEYREFLKVYGGGYYGFLVIFSGDINSDWNIIRQNKELNLLDRLKFLAVSDIETGDFYGFKVSEGICETRVSVFQHDDYSISPTEYEDFYEFVLRLGFKI